MILQAGFIAFLVSVGVWCLLARCPRRMLIGASLICQGTPLSVIVMSARPELETLALVIIVIGIGSFLAITAYASRMLQQPPTNR